MTDVSAPPRPKSGKLGLIFAFVLVCLAGFGGFWITYFDPLHVIPPQSAMTLHSVSEIEDIAFVPVGPLVMSLGPQSRADHLRFSANIEVHAQYEADVIAILPRLQDVMLTYLRAVSPQDLVEPYMMVKLRAQLLRRLKMVAGPERIVDVLITDFVLD